MSQLELFCDRIRLRHQPSKVYRVLQVFYSDYFDCQRYELMRDDWPLSPTGRVIKIYANECDILEKLP